MGKKNDNSKRKKRKLFKKGLFKGILKGARKKKEETASEEIVRKTIVTPRGEEPQEKQTTLESHLDEKLPIITQEDSSSVLDEVEPIEIDASAEPYEAATEKPIPQNPTREEDDDLLEDLSSELESEAEPLIEKALEVEDASQNLPNFDSSSKKGSYKHVVKPYTDSISVKTDSTQMSWAEVRAKQKENNLRESDQDKIVDWHRRYAESNPGNYAIVDKKSCTLTVYSADGSKLETLEIALGSQEGDAVTKSYKDKENPDNRPTTGAGVYTIKSQGINDKADTEEYGDNIFLLEDERGIEQATALHQIPNSSPDRHSKMYDGDLENNRFSHGCVNFMPEDFDKMEALMGLGGKVYILPEDSNNYFVEKNGQMNLTQHDYTGDVLTTPKSDKIKPIEIDGNYLNRSKIAKAYASELARQKETVIKMLGIDNDTYNDIAKMSIGILYQESEVGRSGKYKLKETFQWLVNLVKAITGRDSVNSRGLTQLKTEAYNDEVKGMLDKLGVTPDNLTDPAKAAPATMLILGYMYKNELPALKEHMEENGLKATDALLYLYQGKRSEITNETATPDKNLYIQNVTSFANNFTLKQME